MRLIGAYGMEDGVTLTARMHIGSDGITADLLGCFDSVEPIGKPVESLVKIDVDWWELYALLVGLGIFVDNCIVQ
jgi:hypothetical protein